MNNQKQAKSIISVFVVESDYKVRWHNTDNYGTYKIYLEKGDRRFFPKQVGRIVTDIMHATTPNFLMKDAFVSEVYLVDEKYCVISGLRPRGSLLSFEINKLNSEYRYIAQ